MPSPFPGMDPYLENPFKWRGTHNTLIAHLQAALTAALPPPYFCEVEERVYILPDERRAFMPDAAIRARSRPLAAAGGVAVREEADPGLDIAYYIQDEREIYLQIRAATDHNRIVTVIELLSPTNKEGHPGRESYLSKQRDLLRSETHFIEIDLLRAGRHTVAAPLEFLPPKREWDYVVCLHRGGQSERFTVWTNRLRDRLPRIAAPLDAGVSDVVLDLQTIFDRNYADGPYAVSVDYRSEPVPPLAPEDAAWADALLREKGLRP